MLRRVLPLAVTAAVGCAGGAPAQPVAVDAAEASRPRRGALFAVTGSPDYLEEALKSARQLQAGAAVAVGKVLQQRRQHQGRQQLGQRVYPEHKPC